MSAEIVNTSNGMVTVRISGLATYPEFSALQQTMADFVRQYPGPGKVRILAILKDFLGWAREGDWGDTTLMDEYDPFIERMAIVGDIAWKEQVQWFTLKGLRKASIEYFQPADLDKALAWLG